VRKHTRLVVKSLLTGAAVVWCVPGADAQTTAGGEPARGAWTPHVIATARPATDTSPPVAPAVPTVRQQPSDVPPAVRTGLTTNDAAPLPPLSPDAVRLVSGPQHPTPAAGPQGACLRVEKVAPAAVAPGKPLAYEIVVRNVGGAEAQRVRVEEQVPAGSTVVSAEPRPEVRGTVLTWDLGNLGAGAEARLRVALQPPADGDVTTTAVVSCATTSMLHTHVARSGLALSVATPPPARVGDGVTFKIQLVNNSATPLRGLLLRARLADGLRHAAGSLLEATIPALAPGEVKSVPLELVAAKAGRLSLAASIAAPGGEPVSGEAAVEVSDTAAAPPAPAPVPPAAKPPESPRGSSDALPLPLPPPTDQTRSQSAAPAGGATVTFDVKDADPVVEVGRETTYEIRVLNQGAAPTRDVLVKAVVPDEMTFVHADDPAGRPVRVYGQEVAFEPLASLGGRGEAVYHVRVKATKPGDGRFTARLQCAAMSRPLSQEVSTRVYTDQTAGGQAGAR
jgi:uncharacterized repeat protein (TIGR01451 family)